MSVVVSFRILNFAFIMQRISPFRIGNDSGVGGDGYRQAAVECRAPARAALRAPPRRPGATPLGVSSISWVVTLTRQNLSPLGMLQRDIIKPHILL